MCLICTMLTHGDVVHLRQLVAMMLLAQGKSALFIPKADWNKLVDQGAAKFPGGVDVVYDEAGLHVRLMRDPVEHTAQPVHIQVVRVMPKNLHAYSMN